MQYKTVGNHVFFRVDPGEELIEQIITICLKENITLGTVQGIGATDKVTVGLFSVKEKQYFSKTFTGDHEITQLMGNITQLNEKPYLHVHITLCNRHHECVGGHLNKAVISATFEGVITFYSGGFLNRFFNDEMGLNLLAFSKKSE